MDSNNLTTRTYTALTCELIVSNQDKQQHGLQPSLQSLQQDRHHWVDFILHLDDPDREELDPISLEGQFHQLDLLQQVVNQYITELIAKFPLPTMNNSTSDQSRTTTADRDRPESTPTTEPDNSIGSKLYPSNDAQSTKSGLMNNLPGLRNNSEPSPAANEPNPQSNSAAGSGISKLFGGWNKRNHDKNRSSESKPQHTPLGAGASVKSGFGKREIENLAESKSANGSSPTTPYLTGNDRSLDQQLHLGDLATETSGDVVTLSPLQLFDLSTVLDEYAADDAATSTATTPSATVSRTNIPTSKDRLPAADQATTALSRLPNLPRPSGGSQTSQVFNRTRHTNHGPQFSFMSVVPWAAAAAVAVGIPLLLLDPQPNPLKDAASKAKMPDLEGVKKTVAGALAPPDVDAEPTDNTPSTNLPKPWQEQSVQPPPTGKIASNSTTQLPPANTNLPNNTQPPQSIGKIGIAPLPTQLVGKPGQDLPIAGIPSNNNQPISSTLPTKSAPLDVAPNPLSSPGGVDSMGAPKLSPAAKSVLKTAKTIPTKTTGVQSGNSAEPVAPVLGSMTKPILSPLDLPGIGINPSQPQLSPVQIDPVGIPSTATKTTKPKANPKVAAKTAQPKPVKSMGVSTVRQPLFEQSAPIPPNPNFLNPAQLPIISNAEFQNLPPADPAFPPSSTGNWPGDSIDSPSLQETKRYFQSKWKANNTQANALQYVVKIGGKNGLIKGIAPQGEAATTYLQKSKFAKVGQKLVSPAAAGTTDQKIRLILQPDGNVDTFVEP
jgi:Domain of unknown function (DUF4335)